jgi:proteasome component ECM29
MMSKVIPFLVSSLEASRSPDIQNLSRKTLLEVIKKSDRKYLQPFAPGLIHDFITMMSSIEPGLLSHARLAHEHYKLTGAEVDDIRLMVVKHSPIMEAVERILDALEPNSMEESMEKLFAAIKTSIGFPSKVASCRVLVSLCMNRRHLFKPYADKFLNITVRSARDPNPHIAGSFAMATGYLLRLCSEEQVFKTLKDIHKLYFDSEDDQRRLTSGDIMAAFIEYAPERATAFHNEILPFIFFAKHDGTEPIRVLYSKTWDNTASGSRKVSLYLKEIAALASTYLDSPRWNIRHTACRTIADAVVSLAKDEISDADAATLWLPLEKTLSGKTWEGKEVTVTALVNFVKKASNFWKVNNSVATQIIKVIIPLFRYYIAH